MMSAANPRRDQTVPGDTSFNTEQNSTEQNSTEQNHSVSHESDRRALITGITGQDGFYLAQSLLADGYRVHGTTREASSRQATQFSTDFAEAIAAGQVSLHPCDLRSPEAVAEVIVAAKPTEVYHLAAQSHVGRSFEEPIETLGDNGMATLVLLEAVRDLTSDERPIRFVNASSSELFAGADDVPQTEQTAIRPISPYGCTKAYAHLQTICHRDAYGLHASNAVLFSHESPRRPVRYVTRKITRAAARIAAGVQSELVLGNLDVGRDWGDARDTVRALRLIASAHRPDDYIVATNTHRTLAEFLDTAFAVVGLDWRSYVRQDPGLVRPRDAVQTQGDWSKIHQALGWTPQRPFEAWVREMVEVDQAILRSGEVD